MFNSDDEVKYSENSEDGYSADAEESDGESSSSQCYNDSCSYASSSVTVIFVVRFYTMGNFFCVFFTVVLQAYSLL